MSMRTCDATPEYCLEKFIEWIENIKKEENGVTILLDTMPDGFNLSMARYNLSVIKDMKKLLNEMEGY